jgi:hypothetical protein
MQVPEVRDGRAESIGSLSLARTVRVGRGESVAAGTRRLPFLAPVAPHSAGGLAVIETTRMHGPGGRRQGRRYRSVQSARRGGPRARELPLLAASNIFANPCNVGSPIAGVSRLADAGCQWWRIEAAVQGLSGARGLARGLRSCRPSRSFAAWDRQRAGQFPDDLTSGQRP